MADTAGRGRTRGSRLTLVTAAAVALTLVARFWPGMTMLDRMELRTVDWRFAQRGERAPNPDIVIVNVDDASIDEIGRWPWPRREMAEVIEALDEAGARTIGFDIFFADPDKSGGGAESDQALVDATRNAGMVFHAAFGYGPDAQPNDQSDSGAATYGWPDARIAGGDSAAGLYQMGNVIPPLPGIMDAAAGIGFVNVVDSGDGVFRHTFPVALYGETPFPSLALAMCAHLLDVSPDQVTIAPGRCVKLGTARTIPIDRGGRMMIDFAGGDRTYPYVSVIELREMTTSPAEMKRRFEDKIALVAVSAPGLYDLRACPFSTVYNGVETQANIVANILDERFLRQIKGEWAALVIALCGAVVLLGLGRLPPTGAIAGAVALLGGYNYLCVKAFSDWGLVVDMIAPNLVMIATMGGMLALRLAREETELERVRDTLARFVPETIAERVVDAEPESLLRGQRRVVTVLFADLRGFTSKSENMPPEEAVELLNRFFLFTQEVIFEFEGTLDKYIGDGLMAFFNAPVEQHDHALRGVQMAVHMQRRIKLNAAEWEFLGMPDLAAGVGISTGEVVVGYVGTGERMQYTAIGSSVNLAARLEGLNKDLGTDILISQSTYELVADHVIADPMGPIEVRGFSEPVEVYSVRDLKTAANGG
jgi:adenylate cyclase